jgi:hypothetical protein
MSARDPLHDVELNSARAPRGAIRDFTRGSEIWWHQAVLFLVSFKNAVLLCLVIGFLFFLLLVVTKTTGKDFKRLIEYSKASLMVSMGAGDQMTSVTVDDRSLKMSSGAAVIVLNDRVEESTDVLWKAAFAAAIVSATLLLIGVPLVARYGK